MLPHGSTKAARSVLEERHARTERIVVRKDRSGALRKINGKFLCTPTGFFLQGTIWIAAIRAFFAMSFDIVLRKAGIGTRSIDQDFVTPRRIRRGGGVLCLVNTHATHLGGSNAQACHRPCNFITAHSRHRARWRRWWWQRRPWWRRKWRPWWRRRRAHVRRRLERPLGIIFRRRPHGRPNSHGRRGAHERPNRHEQRGAHERHNRYGRHCRVAGWSGGTGTWKGQGGNWRSGNWGHGHHGHHHRHNRVFFVGGGPWWWGDYGYYDNGCWQLVETRRGLRRVWVCGDYY